MLTILVHGEILSGSVVLTFQLLWFTNSNFHNNPSSTELPSCAQASPGCMHVVHPPSAGADRSEGCPRILWSAVLGMYDLPDLVVWVILDTLVDCHRVRIV